MNKEKLQKLILQKRSEINWQTVYEENGLECEEKALDFICEHIEFKEKLLNSLYVQAYQMDHELNNLDIIDINVDEGVKIITDFMDKFEPLEAEYYKKIDEVKDNFLVTGLKIRELIDRVIKLPAFYFTNNKDIMLLTNKSFEFKQKMANIATSFGYDELLEGDNIFRYIRDDLKTMYRVLVKRQSREMKEAIKELEEIKKERLKHSKIFDYKEMCKYAIQQGYEECRQGATDHKIFKFVETGKIVPIPTHNLGVGLAETIKKQIRENKIA